MRRLLILITPLFVLTCEPLRAADKNVGTSGAAFLQMGAGARPTGMGDAYVGLADDVNAIYFNPAGLSQIEKTEVTIMHTQWFQDINYQFGAAVFPTSIGSFGISAATLEVESLERRGLNESLDGTFDNLDAAYGLSYGRALDPQLSVGGTLRFIDQEIDTASAQTWSGDLGALYKLKELPLSVGLAARHFGQGVEFNEESDPLPFTIDLGVGSHLYKDRVTLGLDIRHPRDNDLQFGLGGEYQQPLGESLRFMVRSGYNSSITDSDGASGFTLGGGLGFHRFDLDFAWVPLGDLGNTFRYAALIRF